MGLKKKHRTSSFEISFVNSIYRISALLWLWYLIDGSVVKNPPANIGEDTGLGTSPGEGNDNPFQGSCLGNPIEKGAWWATVHGGSQRVGHDSATDQQQPEVSPEKGKNEISQFLLFQHRVGYSGSFGFHMNTISPHSFYSWEAFSVEPLGFSHIKSFANR